jgi:hypothetical protein
MPTESMQEFRFQRYQRLAETREDVFQEFRDIANELDQEDHRKERFGLLGGSGGPPVLGESIRAAIDKGSGKYVSLATLDTRVRELVKGYYGDEWDGVVVSTAEAALWVTFESLIVPPLMVRGDKYWSSFITPLERHTHHQAAYGDPFPPWLKDHMADRGVTAGELSVMAKRRENVRAIFFPLVGASYECHGIKYHPAFLLLNTDAAGSIEKLKSVMQMHLDHLSGFVSMGYDTPGYGYAEKGKNGEPVLQRSIGEIASGMDIPYIVDNARGTPFLGVDPREINASVMIYSCDKAFGGPTAGLIIGKEQYMIPIRRALGVHGNRWGTPSSHGKAGYVMVDPGKEALLGTVASLEMILDNSRLLTEPMENLSHLVKETASDELGKLSAALTLSSSTNSLGVEVNYENTWETDTPIPIFPIEDFYSGANLIQYGMAKAGMGSPLCYDANIVLGPLSNLCTTEGTLDEAKTRFALKVLFRGIKRLTERFNSTG